MTEPPAARSASPSATPTAEVAVIGLGYVGLTLAVTLASEGVRVLGVERRSDVRDALHRRVLPFFEPGIANALTGLADGALAVVADVPDVLPPVVIVTVGTPADPDTGAVDLSQLHSALDAIAPAVADGSLVVLRSTLPVGTCRRIVAPRLQRDGRAVHVAFCPERTIQGQAYEELRSLPQVVGGLDPAATEAAVTLFARLTPSVVPVSSVEAAEAIKLLCNAHTDLIYGFGNQVALLAEELGLDARELVAAANHRYPRPDLSRPGFVGGSCLIKDPYLLAHSLEGRVWSPTLSMAARQLNESIPVKVADRVLATLKEQGTDLGAAKVLLCGLAYKGRPETDDTRGSAAPPILAHLRGTVDEVVVHDPVVGPDAAERIGARWVDLEAGFADADAALVLIDHPAYVAMDIASLTGRMRRPAVVHDTWGILDGRLAGADGITYLQLGRGALVPEHRHG